MRVHGRLGEQVLVDPVELAAAGIGMVSVTDGSYPEPQRLPQPHQPTPPVQLGLVAFPPPVAGAENPGALLLGHRTTPSAVAEPAARRR